MRKKIIVMIVMICSTIGLVYAKENDTKVRVDYLQNVYGNFKIGEVFYWNQIGLTYANNKLAYCLEPGKWITETTYDSYTDFSIKNLNQKDKEYLELVAYYGYQYKNHKTTKYYLATQELIWRYLGLKEIYWTTKSEHQGNRIDVENEKNEIKKLMNSHKNQPSFHGKTYDAISGVPFDLDDENKVFHEYEIMLPVSHGTSISGDSIRIYPEKVGESTISFLRHPDAYQASFLYTKNDSQALGTFGLSRKIEANVHLRVKGYRLTLHKKDAYSTSNEPSGSASLAGAIYEITNGLNYYNTLTTNQKGEAILNDIPAGTYKIKEVKASEGYLLDKNIYTVTFGPDTNLEVEMDVLEKVIENKIKLVKVFSDGNTGILNPEIAIRFGIYKKEGGLYKEVTTDSYGEVTFMLPYGTYLVKQLNTLPNYEKVDDFEIQVTEEKEEVFQYILHDKFINSKLKIKKVDENGNPIKESGVTFKIKNLDTGKYVEQELTYPKQEIIEIFETNENGEILLPKPLPAGNYQLEEIKAPHGYYLLKKPISFTLNENTEYEKTEDGLCYTIEVKNEKQRGKLKIYKNGIRVLLEKKDDGTYEQKEVEELLTGVKFQLYANEDIIENGQVIYKKDELVEELITKDGKVTSKELPLGSYCVKETETIKDYVLPDYENCFKLEASENQDEPILKEYSFLNTRAYTKIKLHKEKEQMKEIRKGKGVYETLVGSNIEFGIYNQDTIIENGLTIEKGTLLMKKKTDKDGNLEFINLPLGRYIIRELTELPGYKKEKEISVILTKEKTKTFISLVNKKKKGSILIIKQDSTGKLLSNAVFTLKDEKGQDIYQSEVEENGSLLLENLEYGTYYLEEKEAPLGYKREKRNIKIEVKQDQVVEKIIVKNKKLFLPKTSSLTKTIEFWTLTGFGSMISFFFISYLLKKRRHG